MKSPHVAELERRRTARAELLADTERRRKARIEQLARIERTRNAPTITEPIPGNPNPGDSPMVSAARILNDPYPTGRPNAATLRGIPGNPNSPPEFPQHPTAGRRMTEEENWDDMERMRSQPQMGWREWQAHKAVKRINAERQATLKSLYRSITGSELHDGSPGTLLLLEVLRELRELKSLVLNGRR
jgi:hypothetical protein